MSLSASNFVKHNRMSRQDSTRRLERSMEKEEAKKAAEQVREVFKRRGIVFLGDEDLIRLLNLPEGYTVMGVHDSFAGMGVKVLICGPGLEEVGDGMEAPWIPSTRTLIFDPEDEDKVIGMKINVGVS